MFRNKTFLHSLRGFLQGILVLLHLDFIFKHSITWNHKGRELAALVQAGLEVLLIMGKKDCVPFPMNVGWCIKIRNEHVQNTISLVFPEIPNEQITTFFCWCRHSFSVFNICATTWVDLRSVADYSFFFGESVKTFLYRNTVGSTLLQWELWRQGREAQTWFSHGIGWLILLSCTQGHGLWRI